MRPCTSLYATAVLVLCVLLSGKGLHAEEFGDALTVPFHGASDQVQRVLDEISTLLDESPEESRTLLRDNQQYIRPNSGGRLTCEELCLERILATRRPLKVIEEVATLPNEHRAQILKSEMKLLAEEYLRGANVAVAWYDDSANPKNDVSFRALTHSACTLLYAAACHSDESTVSDLIRTWRPVANKVERIIDASTAMPDTNKGLLVQWAQLPAEDLYNILRRCNQVSGGFEEVARMPLPASVQADKVVVVPWQAIANNYDMAVVVQGAQLDLTRGFEEVEVYSFCLAARTTTAQDSHQSFLQEIERILDSFGE